MGAARVRFDGGAAHFNRAAADIEGFARTRWGLTPLATAGAEFYHWELYRQGLANGTDPEHLEHWGPVNLTASPWWSRRPSASRGAGGPRAAAIQVAELF